MSVRGRAIPTPDSMSASGFIPPLQGFGSYENAFGQLSQSVPAWLQQLRAAALDTFRQLGFPSQRLEDWKYTDTTPIAREVFQLPRRPPATEPRAELWEPWVFSGGAAMVFFQGWPLPLQPVAPPLPDEVSLLSLQDALAKEEALVRGLLGTSAPLNEQSFTALNTALLDEGAWVRLAPGARLATPIQLLFVGGSVEHPTILCPRNFIVLGDGAEATVIECWIGESSVPFLTNGITEVVLGEEAHLTHVRILAEREAMLHMGLTAVRQSRGSTFRSQVITFPGQWTRVEIHTRLEAPAATALLDGLFVANGSSFVDHHTTIDHAQGATTSRQLYKGVLNGASHGVFNGKVFVRPGALKSDAQQMNKNLLLSDDAEIDTKPQLEIFADDVKCSHGAAIGQLDEEALFYLRSRGVAAGDARHMLIYGFANEIVERVPWENARRRLRAALQERLATAPPEDPA